MVEQRPFKALVPGSSPGQPTSRFSPLMIDFHSENAFGGPRIVARNETRGRAQKRSLFVNKRQRETNNR